MNEKLINRVVRIKLDRGFGVSSGSSDGGTETPDPNPMFFGIVLSSSVSRNLIGNKSLVIPSSSISRNLSGERSSILSSVQISRINSGEKSAILTTASDETV